MCGIAGFFEPRGQADLARVRAMCREIVHRGPDDEGFHTEGGCAIGMRRLSIIDLEAGHQPIGNEDGSIQVVFNGEIYNYRELRENLAAQGHRFRTHSDTEVLVHLYEQEGPEGIARLRGMFAFAIWDSRQRRLLLARDRFGKKPLYYAILPGGLYFGSELKCLQVCGVPFEVDREALKLYFQFSYIPDPHSPYKAVKKLQPGSWLLYGANGDVKQGRYWKLPVPKAEDDGALSFEDAKTAVREKFDESVRIRMVADVPLGAFLSGGIDSSSVVASMARQSPEPVKTFSIGFEESDFNELKYAGMVAKRYGTDHHEILVRPDSVSLVTRIVRHFDEPFADSSAIPTFIVSEFASRYVKVVLTGDGGDELFGGYESFFAIQKRARWDRLPGFSRTLLSILAERLPYSAYGKNFLRMISRPTALERYFENNSAPYYMRKAMLTPEWMLPADAAFLFRAFPDCLLPEGTDTLSQAMYFEATAKLTGDMLVKVDRMSMANSLEVRSPLLDHELADVAAAIPHEWKVREGKGKHILVEALGERLPPELLNRPKMGFGVPLAHWFRGPLREFLWDHLLERRFQDRGMVSPEFVRGLLDEHQSRRRDNSGWLWSLLTIELWFRNLEQSRMEQPEAACH
jgi:asparagine synthase (glutamine-hydrolysing)